MKPNDTGDVEPALPKDASSGKATVTYSVSPGFVALLARLGISVAITSYQSGKFYLLGRNPKGGLMINERLFQKAMGLYAEGNTLLLATLFQIQRFENVLEKGQFINHTYDACFVPRLTHTTGVLDAHDVGLLANGEIIFVNTRYNCLATTSTRDSFTPVWKPPFISQIVSEDRCHLNGLAMDKGQPRYVTAVSQSNTIDGWRDRRSDGGVVIDVATGEVVCKGLSMPHSPRLFKGKLWVLNSGTGELGWVDTEKKEFKPLTFCPGFLRGLAFRDGYAFVGLSKPRYERFEGLALDAKLKAADSEPWCGVQVIDLKTGACVEWFRIDGAVAEIYDAAVVPDVACPMSLGFASDEIKGLITHSALNESYLTEAKK
ncbi:MAG: TIGR03032 family protein [Alphaproteobacteria bacterium]|nr:TIGR03032 family protein [Alphaproteobacteria bacterium]